MHPKARLSTLLVALAIPVPKGYVTGVPKSDESPVQSQRLGPWFGFLLCIHSKLDQDGERICGSKYSFWNPWNYTESKLSKQTVLLTLGEGGVGVQVPAGRAFFTPPLCSQPGRWPLSL